MKDRIGRVMIEDIERRGVLKKGSTIASASLGTVGDLDISKGLFMVDGGSRT